MTAGDPVIAPSLGLGLEAARRVILAAIELGELDGFIAGDFLERYELEVPPSTLKAASSQLVERYEFTRTNVARLGIALARGWVVATPDAVTRFVDGYDRMERQRPDQALDYRSSIKLLWGVALGAAAPAIRARRTDPYQQAVHALQTLGEQTKQLREAVLVTAVLAELAPLARAARARALARRVLTTGAIDESDVVAALWAITHDCFGGPGAVGAERDDLHALAQRLVPGVFRVQPVDVIDALMADDVLGGIARDLAVRVSAKQDALLLVQRTFDYFPEIARRMRERKHGRALFVIENEYDVQDLLYVALKPHLPDLTDEEWTSKDAGGAKRIDLVTAAHRICIEAKRPRNAGHARDIADELRVDVESYYVHPACDTLVTLVYDPDGLIADPRAVEGDLSGPRTIKGRRVEVVVLIRPR